MQIKHLQMLFGFAQKYCISIIFVDNCLMIDGTAKSFFSRKLPLAEYIFPAFNLLPKETPMTYEENIYVR